MSEKENEKTRENEGERPEVVVLPPKGQRTCQTPKPVMPVGASGPAPGRTQPRLLVHCQRCSDAGHGEKAIARVGAAPSKQPSIANRMLLGAIAGMVGTAAMTGAMRALHRRLAPAERYPLPPREIIDQVLPEPVSEESRRASTIASHFAYGAGMGAVYALAPLEKSILTGAGYGVLVWAGSYLGWIPSARILENAVQHPLRRNLLMNTVHLIWGATTALTLRELERAQAEIFSQGEPRDAPSTDAAGETRSGSQSPRSCSAV